MSKFMVTKFAARNDIRGRRVALKGWAAFARSLMSPVEVPKKDAAKLFSPATFRSDLRATSNVELVYAMAADFDDLPAARPGDALQGLRPVYEALSKYSGVVVSTHTHTLARPRCRWFGQISRPVTADEYEELTEFFLDVFVAAGLGPDTKCSDAGRAWYVPSRSSADAPFRAVATNSDRPIDVDAALANLRAQRSEPAPVDQLAFARGDVARCRAYVAKMEPAISGASGHNATFRVACAIVQRFGLTGGDAMAVLEEYNERCQPTWSRRELEHKIESATKAGAA